MQLTTLLSALALTTIVVSQNTTESLLAICNAQHDACDTSPDANHSFCASQYFGCLGAAGTACGCDTVLDACFANSTNIFDCAPVLANCSIACQNGSKGTTTSATTSKTSATSSTVTSAPSGAPNTTDSLLAICGAQHDACDVAPDANHAFCASQYFQCLNEPGVSCNCEAVEQACFSTAANIFDCAQPIAACSIACQNHVTTTTSGSKTSTISSMTSSVTGLPSGAPNTTASLLAICGAQHDACDTAPEANHAFCGAQYFGCLDFGDTCGCGSSNATRSCLQNPPTGNLFDCGPAVAACNVACQSGSSTSSSSSIYSSTTTCPSISTSTKSSTHSVPTSTIYSNTTSTSVSVTSKASSTVHISTSTTGSSTKTTSTAVQVTGEARKLGNGAGLVVAGFLAVGGALLL